MPLYFFGSILVVMQIAIAWLSQSFIFGQGHAERPIIAFLILEFFAFAAYVAAVEWVLRFLPRSPRRRSLTGRQAGAQDDKSSSLAWILFIGVLCRMVFLPSQFIQETDPYRYIWDGQSVLQGANPYEHSPQDALRDQRVTAKPLSLTLFPQAGREEGEGMIETFQKINHADIKTIYPPFAQMLFAMSQLLSPWNFLGWRFMILLAEIGILITLAFSLKKFGLRQEWLLLYAWSPLVLKEFSNSLHLDVFAVLFLTLSAWAVLRQRLLWAFASLALAAGIKLFSIALVPLLCVWGWKKAPKEALKGGLLFVAILSGLYLPFVSAGSSLFEGLQRFAGEWQVNAGVFILIKAWFLRVEPFAIYAEWLSRATVAALFLILLFRTIQWLKSQAAPEALLKSCLVVVAGLFFLAPTGNPWYFTWIFPFLIFFPSRALILFSGLVFLYYLDFYFSYQGLSQNFKFVTWVEYGIFYLFLGWELGSRHLFRPRSGPMALQSSEISGGMDKKTSVAIIVPVVNEKNLIRGTLKHLLSLGADEVIAVDGGSKDGTCEIIMRDFPSVRCFETAYADRALQMNLGAFEATSGIFLFVHADMRLAQNAVERVRKKIQQGFVGGGFKKRYLPTNWIMNIYAFLQNTVYLGMMKCLVGSNAIFAVRSVFDAEHGFPDVAFLEDLMFSECLSRRGKIAIIDEPVTVSSRRYFQSGVLRQILKNGRIMMGYKIFREDLESLRQRYTVFSHGL